jgi:hypothetical protein
LQTMSLILPTEYKKRGNVMDNTAVKTKTSKGRPDAMKLLLIAGLSVQAWGVLMGLGLLILNFTH